MNKINGILSVVLGLVIIVVMILSGISYANEYNNKIGNYWTLADRASTIQQKSDYINKFYNALNTAGLQGTHDALFYFNPSNSFDENLNALKSLKDRLETVKTMDENSFAYQTAIQQITGQEQGEAKDMIGIFSGSWWKVHHYWLWNAWIVTVLIVLSLFFIVGGVVFISYDY